ncbi:MAG: hypothetical protein CVV41_17820 [Candidatus Riflebacteria bacterium HGW-Riflebacteria-1]|jgi:PAS domain S-box-containing protein|nr:MAG: hypothetical protein CVV41_17820 [Candidatus Riflebacteria bacterium HGW-Riflebacteria-1]
MLETSYSNFFTSGYYIFANGILLITLAAITYGFDSELTDRFKLRWLATGILAAGVARILFSFSLLQHNPLLLTIESGCALLSIHLFFEYSRRSYSENASGHQLLLHLPLFLLLTYGFWYSGMAIQVRAVAFLLIGLLVSYAGLRKSHQLPAEVKRYAQGCFALAAIAFTMHIGARLGFQFDWQTLEPISGARAVQWKFLLPSALDIAIIILAMLARHAREKLHWHSLRGDLGFYSHLLFLSCIVVVLWAGGLFGRHIEKQWQFQSEVTLTQAIESLSELINYRMLMAANYSYAIAAAPILAQYLEQPDPANHKLLEDYLDTISPRDPEGMCFLTGLDGKILVSSNSDESMIGFDVSFRDYFKKAMAGKSSDMIDYGKFTGQLGFYSINPVISNVDGKVLGACVVKRNLVDIEDLLKLYHPAMIVDESGVIFVASDKRYERRNYIHCLKTGSHTHRAADETASNADLIVHVAHAVAKIKKEGWLLVMLPGGNSDNKDLIWLMITLSLICLTLILTLNSAVINIRSRESYEVAQERFQTVFYHAPDSMIIISAKTLEILEANHSMTRQFGLIGDVIGLNYLKLLPACHNDLTHVWHDRAEKLFKHRRTFVRSNGEAFCAEVTGAPVTFNYHKAIILLLHDITAQKQHELELQQAKNAAENANKLKSRFFANASHEIRTPMTAIIGLTEMALTLCESEEQRRLLNLTRSSGKSLLELVNDILDLSKIESGKFSIRPTRFDLHQLLRELEQLFVFEARNSQINVVFSLDQNLPRHILSDGVRIRQILLNLLSNAVKFTDTGSISLQAKVIAGHNAERIEMKISDTGGGISPDKQEHLFEPFTYGDQYTRYEAKGAGLGLAICKQITDLLEGRLFIEKTGSTGTVFILEIPFGRGEAISEEPPVQVLQPKLCINGRPLHFLIADDNEINLFLAGSIIEKFGGSHQYARNGREALDMLAETQFDAALIDIQMPEVDGLAVIRQIRSSSGNAGQLPVIAVSAFISDQEKQEALQAGANSYLVKPYFPNDLLKAIANLAITHTTEETATETQTQTATISMPIAALKQIDADELEIRILKKPENILKISDIFARRSVELLAELAECEQMHDCLRLREVAHSIKGLAGMLGAKKSFQLARDIEDLCKNSQIEQALQQLAVLKQHITEISQDLKILQQQVSKKTV